MTASKKLKKYSCCETPYPEIYYKLRIRRRPLYYVFNMIFPCLLITLVAFLGFLLPPDSIEKVGTGITTLLSLTVFLMLVAESLPPTSEQLPLLGIYYFITISIVSFSTFMAVITLNINNKGLRGKRLPPLVKVIFFNYVAKILGTRLIHNNKYKKIVDQRLINSPKYAQDLLGTSGDNVNMPIYKETTTDANLNVLHHKQKIKHVAINCKDSGLVLKARDDCFNNSDTVYDFDSFSAKKSGEFDCSNNSLNLNETTPIDILYNVHCTCKKSQKKKKSSQERFSITFVEQLDTILQKHFNKLILAVTNTIERKEQLFDEKVLTDQLIGEWMDLALICDHFLCYFFPLMTLIFCFIIFLSSPHVFSHG